MFMTLLLAGAVADGYAIQRGPFDVPVERIAVLARVQGMAATATGLPLGAAVWEQPFDPGDHAPLGVDFSALLDDGETIGDVDAISLSPAAAALGIAIDTAVETLPSIDEDGARRLQLWLSVATGSQNLASFDASGVRIAIAFRIFTSKRRRYERSALLTVRQL